MKKLKYIKIFTMAGVPIFMHWSLSLVLMLLALYALLEASMLIAAISFFAIMLFHELGHMWFALKLGLKPIKIRLYLLHGRFFFEQADNEYHTCLVSWGGVAAQAIIFIPCVIIFSLYGAILPWYVNTPLLILGYVNASVAVFNLLPIKGLDGEGCWKSVFLYFKFFKEKSGQYKKRRKHLKSVK